MLGSDAALALERVPESLLVIGGGYIGLELGSVYAALGSRVTVAEMTAGLLPGADRDLVRRLRRGLEDAFEAIRLDTSVLSVEEDGDGLAAVLAGPEGAPVAERFGAALVAVGRRPNTAGLGLERTGARLDARGFVEVDARRRTADPAIYAVGDAAGEPMLAHKATHEAHVAVEAIAGRPAAWDPRAVPAVVYTRPEIAWVGLTETEALDRRLVVETSTLPWAASGRAALAGADDGATKLVLEPRTHRLLGAGAVGPGAGDLIAEAALGAGAGRDGAGPRTHRPPPPHPLGDADERRRRLLRAQPGLRRPQPAGRGAVRLEFAFLSDFAEESGGKLHALGIGVDAVHAPAVPARHPQLTMGRADPLLRRRGGRAPAGGARPRRRRPRRHGPRRGRAALPGGGRRHGRLGARAGQPRRRAVPRLRRLLLPPPRRRPRDRPRRGPRRAAARRRRGRRRDGVGGGMRLPGARHVGGGLRAGRWRLHPRCGGLAVSGIVFGAGEAPEGSVARAPGRSIRTGAGACGELRSMVRAAVRARSGAAAAGRPLAVRPVTANGA